jgi:prolyl oligopeptidase
VRRIHLSYLLFALPPSLASALGPPPGHPVTDSYWGAPVVDDYRWMETPSSPQLTEWMKAQNAYTRSIIRSMPGHAGLLREIDRASNATTRTSGVIRAGGDDFYLQTGAGEETGKLYMRVEGTGATRLLVDPDRFGKPGIPAGVNFFQPSYERRFAQ